MTTYTMTGPDGKDYSIDGPPGATEDQVREQMQLAHGNLQSSTAGGADTMRDSMARGLPPLTRPNVFGLEKPVAPPARPLSEQAAELGNFAGGAATGIPAGLAGIPGDIEGVGRWLLSKVSNVSPETTLPTSSQAGNLIAGEPTSDAAAQGRTFGNIISSFAGPRAAKGAEAVNRNVIAPVVTHSLGATTGAGGAAIKEAYQAGKTGGNASVAFLEQMRGKAPVEDVVQTARDAVQQMRADRSAAYKAGIGSTIKGDPAVLDFVPIENAVNNAATIKTFKGQSLSTVADKARQRITETVNEWKALPPDEFHTPEGLDALKQKIGDLIHEGDLSSIKPNSPAAIIVNQAYNAVKNQIVKQAPGYADVMRDYMNASDELRNIEGSLSLGKNAMTDTSLRKLQSILRNNANTNYGQRVKMGQRLASQPGGDTLMPALAGQALSSALPRGIQGGVAGLEGAMIGMTHPGALPLLALSSPRLVGEAAHAAGRLSNTVKKARILPGSGANIPSIGGLSPKALSAMLTPQILSALLLQTGTQTP